MSRADALKLAVEMVNARFAAPTHRDTQGPGPRDWSNAVLALARFLMTEEKGERE